MADRRRRGRRARSAALSAPPRSSCGRSRWGRPSRHTGIPEPKVLPRKPDERGGDLRCRAHTPPLASANSAPARSAPDPGRPAPEILRISCPVVAHQVEAWRRHQGGEFLQQLMWRQHQLARTIGPVRLQGEHQRLGIHEAQPAAGNGWPDDVAAKPLESAPVGGLDAGGGMQ